LPGWRHLLLPAGNGTLDGPVTAGQPGACGEALPRPAWYYGLVDAKRQIVKAMAVIRRPRDGALLVSEHASPLGAPFHRPLGGHVEVGEYALDAVHRELAEEIGQRLTGVRLLGVLENIFQWDGALQHEVVFMFAASFADKAAYEIAEQRILDDTDISARVIWRAPEVASPPLYPDGVTELITQAG
jgi:ADP-ribose pyrophosphatase YjhB (NUDIX family)